ncbi:type II toxin-antitoxin system VapC family toxin [Marimonas sp. MJW-29]|uniref:Ribonuclease VapC n=1 Tax=Sulfitobacter sediminis TaxID=3234186 RepID=A0ABV3RNA6_9RHOB
MFILDTNVISSGRRPERSQTLAAWLYAQPEDALYLSAITLGEIARGIALQDNRNPDFAKDLRAWLDRTETLFADRILPFTAADARLWGQLSARIGHGGADLMIAATALSHGATVVTRNTSNFAPTGVRLLNPF